MKKINTFIIPIIQHGFLKRCLETLYKYTPDNFYVFVIDQTADGVNQNEYKGVHLWIRPYRNLGFSKAHNTGIQLSQTPYITLLNDDVEFVNSGWWQGIMDTFAMEKKIIAVNPNSPKEGAWGYGLTSDNKDTWIPREGFVRDGDAVVPVIDGVVINTPELAKEHYDDLLNKHPIWSKNTLCDGLAMWCTVFKKEGLQEKGLLDERFYPAGGEDYDMMGRIYSCAWPNPREVCDPSLHRRAVGTTKSWVWHWWGKSKDDISAKDPANPLFASRERWNNLDELWQMGFDCWAHGHRTDEKGQDITYPYKRVKEIHIDDL